MAKKNLRIVSDSEMELITGGEAITLTIVCAVLTISILCIVTWKLFNSKNGEVTIPGGFKFTWSAIKSLFK